MKKDMNRRYVTGEFITLVELFITDSRNEKFPITVNDLISTRKERKIKSEDIKFSLLRARVVNERKYYHANYGYRAQLYYGNTPVECFCSNRYRSHRVSSLYDDTFTWLVDEKTIHLLDVNFILFFIKNVPTFNELGERICSGLAEGII